MTTVAQLVQLEPDPTFGIPTQFGDGGWRWAVEIADPGVGTSVTWHDVTCWCAGAAYSRGATSYLDRYQASTATLLFRRDDDLLAPWHPDNSSVFGIHVDIGAGILIRASLFHVTGGATDDWMPRFTLRVEDWGDSTAHEGKTRTHEVLARDTLSDLVNAPVASRFSSSWGDRFSAYLGTTAAGGTDWLFGHVKYGNLSSLTLPAADEKASAVVELDATCDPAGIIWYTDRTGRIIARPMIGDVVHGSTNPIPSVLPTVFSYNACNDGEVAYGISEGSIFDRFGFDDNLNGLLNQLVVSDPVGPSPYSSEDPISIQRYGRQVRSAYWQVANNTVADAMVDLRAYATKQARPLSTHSSHDGFFPAVMELDYLHPIEIRHKTAPGRHLVIGEGYVRNLQETYDPDLPNERITIRSVITNDIITITPTNDDLLPPTNLACGTRTEDSLEFTWTNPAGQPVTPNEVHVRLVPETMIWLEGPYPTTDLTWYGLNPDTRYRFEVRLIYRDPTTRLILFASPVSSIACSTLPRTYPSIVYTPGTYPGYTPPEYQGGNFGSFEVIDAACSVDWSVQEATSDAGPWTEIATGNSEPGLAAFFDGAVLTPGNWYRVCQQDTCGGAEVCGPPWPFLDDCFDDDLSFPFDDPGMVVYIPGICAPNVVKELVHDREVSYGPSFGGGPYGTGLVIDESLGKVYVFSESSSAVGAWQTVIYGVEPDLAALKRDQAHTIDVTIGGVLHGDIDLWRVSATRISIVMDGGLPYIEAGIALSDGTTLTLLGSTSISTLSSYRCTLTYDFASSTMELFVNGESQGVAAHTTPGLETLSSSTWKVELPYGAGATDIAAFDGIPEPASPIPAFFQNDGSWMDGSGATIDITYPEHEVGDIMIVANGQYASGSAGPTDFSPPSLSDSFVSLYETYEGTAWQGGYNLHVMGRRMDGTEGATVQMTGSQNGLDESDIFWFQTMFVLKGVDPAGTVLDAFLGSEGARVGGSTGGSTIAIKPIYKAETNWIAVNICWAGGSWFYPIDGVLDGSTDWAPGFLWWSNNYGMVSTIKMNAAAYTPDQDYVLPGGTYIDHVQGTIAFKGA